MSTQYAFGKIVTNGLILSLDAADRNSYVSGSTTWFDLNNNTTNLTLAVSGSGATSASFNTSNQGTLTFTGSTTAHSYAINTTPNILTGSTDISICMWIYLRTPPQVITTLIDFTHANSDNGWVIQSEDSTTNRYYYFAYWQGSAFQPAGGFGAGKGVQLTYNTWQHFCYTKSNTSVIGYINGIQQVNYTAASATIVYLANIRPFCISAAVNPATSIPSSRFTNGEYGPIQIYNRGLSSFEILQNYEAQKSRFDL